MRSAPLQKRNCHNNWQSVISDSDEWTHDNLFLILSQPHTIMLFQIHENLFLMHSQPTFLHIIIPSWQLTASMHQIGSLICNEHDKLAVKMTILFLICMHAGSLHMDCLSLSRKLTSSKLIGSSHEERQKGKSNPHWLLNWRYYWPGLVCSNVLLKCITVVYPRVYTGIKICPNSPEFTGEAPIFAICWY